MPGFQSKPSENDMGGVGVGFGKVIFSLLTNQVVIFLVVLSDHIHNCSSLPFQITCSAFFSRALPLTISKP